MDRTSQDNSSSSESCVTSAEEETTSKQYTKPRSTGNLLQKLDEADDELTEVKHRFYSNLGKINTTQCPVLAVYKNQQAAGSSSARLASFLLCAEAMKEKRGKANVKNAWYGCSKREALRIIRHGFESSGLGAHLSPVADPLNSVISSAPDGSGMNYLLLCSVILGNAEEICPSSNQSSPSTDEYDSGVDNKEAPTKFTIWPAHVKTRIYPSYLLCIKPAFRRTEWRNPRSKLPTSPWISFSRLVPVLSASLPPHKACLIKKIHVAFLERKITRLQLISRVRLLSGDELLHLAIGAFGSKASTEAMRMHKF